MKRWAIFAAAAFGLYLLSGFYILKGNEKGVVRRFGRVVTTSTGTALLTGSGLHFEWPWPFARVDRVNLNEIRTLSIGSAEIDDALATAFLQPVDASRQSQFLTGDKNILNLQVTVQYRVSEEGVGDYLFGSESAEQRLALVVEATAADLISQSGVDFVHPLGLGELRELLTARTRQLAAESRLGLEVEEVAINSVYPPLRVKADFLDVSNARADKEKYINSALAYEEQRLAAARGESQQVLDEAEIYRRQLVESARGSADSFHKMLAQFQHDEARGIPRRTAQHMALRRHYLDTVETVLRKVAGKVFLDSGKPVDLTIFRDPKE
jgi:membrane protease subunit HflK